MICFVRPTVQNTRIFTLLSYKTKRSRKASDLRSWSQRMFCSFAWKMAQRIYYQSSCLLFFCRLASWVVACLQPVLLSVGRCNTKFHHMSSVLSKLIDRMGKTTKTHPQVVVNQGFPLKEHWCCRSQWEDGDRNRLAWYMCTECMSVLYPLLLVLLVCWSSRLICFCLHVALPNSSHMHPSSLAASAKRGHNIIILACWLSTHSTCVMCSIYMFVSHPQNKQVPLLFQRPTERFVAHIIAHVTHHLQCLSIWDT